MAPLVTVSSAAEHLRTIAGSRPIDPGNERRRQWIARRAAHDRAVHRRLLQACVLALTAATLAGVAWSLLGHAL